MDLSKKLEELIGLKEQYYAQINYVAGQIALVEEMIKEEEPKEDEE